MTTAWWGRLDGDSLMRTAWWGRLGGEDGLVVGTAWWWGRLGGEDGLVVGTAWWWGRLGDENGLMMRTAWWWERLDDEDDLLMRWWIYAAIKSFYLILSNLRFRTISRVEFERRTIAKTRLNSSNKNFCPTRELNRVGLFDMFETQLCDQSMLDAFERVQLLNLLNVIRYRFDFLRQTNDFFKLDFEHNRINSTNYRDLQIKMQNLHQTEVFLIIR
jgi:hypothetical protein